MSPNNFQKSHSLIIIISNFLLYLSPLASLLSPPTFVQLQFASHSVQITVVKCPLHRSLGSKMLEKISIVFHMRLYNDRYHTIFACSLLYFIPDIPSYHLIPSCLLYIAISFIICSYLPTFGAYCCSIMVYICWLSCHRHCSAPSLLVTCYQH